MKKCDFCEEEEMIKGACYDHCKLCPSCMQEPMHPNAEMCDQCYYAAMPKKES